MTSARRRTQIVLVLVAVLLCYIVFFSSEADKGSDFRGKTEAALKRKHSVLSGDISDEDLLAQTNNKLQEILAAKDGPAPSSLQGTRITDDIPVAGRKTMPNPKQSPFQQNLAEKPKYPVKDGVGDEADTKKEHKSSDPGEDMAREELQKILKKSPIIIFSKSYCPHSKRAKDLLLHRYDIQPPPYVVELDLMSTVVPKHKTPAGDDAHEQDVTLGRKLQDLLASLTGRRTVPNIMINTQSIGGASEVVGFDEEGVLLDKILKLGGKRIVSATRLEKEKD